MGDFINKQIEKRMSGIIHLKSDGYINAVEDIPPTIRYLTLTCNMYSINLKGIMALSNKLNRLRTTNVEHLHLELDNFNITDWGYDLNKTALLNNDFATAVKTSLLTLSGIELLKINADTSYKCPNSMVFLNKIIENNTNLRVLDLSRCDDHILSAHNISLILQSIRTTQIRELRLNFKSDPLPYDHNIADHTFEASYLLEFISELEHNQIERVYINNRALTTAIFNQLFAILPRTRVRNLAIAICEHITIDDAVITSSLLNSNLEHIWIRAYNTMPPVSLFASPLLKTKALSVSFNELTENSSDELLTHLTHLALIFESEVSCERFEVFMMKLAKSSISSLCIRFPMKNEVFAILIRYLPQCKNLIEFGCLDGVWWTLDESWVRKNEYTAKLIPALGQSNVRYLIADSLLLRQIAPTLRYTKIIKIMTLNYGRILSNIAEHLPHTYITEIVLGSISTVFWGFCKESLINCHESVVLEDCYASSNLQTALHNNKLKVDEFLTNLDGSLFMANRDTVMWGHVVDFFQNPLTDNGWIDEFIVTFIQQLNNLSETIEWLRFFEANNWSSLSISLLNHRPIFYLYDSIDNIMHPYVYTLFHKYGLPLYQKDMEPGRKQTLIDYFTKYYSDYDESAEVLNILNDSDYKDSVVY